MNDFMTMFFTDEYFVIFLIIMIMILVVLIMALIKTSKDYSISRTTLEEDLLNSFIADSKEETIKTESKVMDENSDVFKSIDEYYDLINEYEINDEESAIISTDELSVKSKEKFEELGVSDNQAMIEKYEEEQEKKAIISYEQLLKNASNMTVTYTEEKMEEGSPRVNKIDVKTNIVSEAQSYIDEEKFLEILKDFSMSLKRG